MYYYFQFESNQILSGSGWYKSLIIYLTLLFDVSRVGGGDAGWWVEQEFLGGKSGMVGVDGVDGDFSTGER